MQNMTGYWQNNFISGINDDGMIDEILKEVAMLEDTEDATSECVLLWVHRVEEHRVQKSALNDIREAKGYDIISQNMQKQEHTITKMHRKQDKCKYCYTGQLPQQCPAHGKKCSGCGKQYHFRAVCKLMQ